MNFISATEHQPQHEHDLMVNKPDELLVVEPVHGGFSHIKMLAWYERTTVLI